MLLYGRVVCGAHGCGVSQLNNQEFDAIPHHSAPLPTSARHWLCAVQTCFVLLAILLAAVFLDRNVMVTPSHRSSVEPPEEVVPLARDDQACQQYWRSQEQDHKEDWWLQDQNSGIRDSRPRPRPRGWESKSQDSRIKTSGQYHMKTFRWQDSLRPGLLVILRVSSLRLQLKFVVARPTLYTEYSIPRPSGGWVSRTQ